MSAACANLVTYPIGRWSTCSGHDTGALADGAGTCELMASSLDTEPRPRKTQPKLLPKHGSKSTATSTGKSIRRAVEVSRLGSLPRRAKRCTSHGCWARLHESEARPREDANFFPGAVEESSAGGFQEAG